MDTVLVTIVTPVRPLDLELDTRCAIARLIPVVVNACYTLTSNGIFRRTRGWQLGSTTHGVFMAGRSLTDYDVWDGAHLLLHDDAYWRDHAGLTSAGHLT